MNPNLEQKVSRFGMSSPLEQTVSTFETHAGAKKVFKLEKILKLEQEELSARS